MNGIITTAIICTTVVLLVWLGGRNTKAEQSHRNQTVANSHQIWGEETRFGSNNRDGGK
jgi:hypothetical protein